jgi:hypothetical protein
LEALHGRVEIVEVIQCSGWLGWVEQLLHACSLNPTARQYRQQLRGEIATG